MNTITFDFIIVAAGPGAHSNVTTVCSVCGACIADWRDSPRTAESDWLYPNQVRHVAWHQSLEGWTS